MTEVALVMFEEAVIAKSNGKRISSLVSKATEGIKNLLYKRGFFRTVFGARLFCFFKRKEIRRSENPVLIADDLCIREIRIPVSQDRLSLINPAAMERLVDKKLQENGKCRCFVPAAVKDKGYFRNLDKCPDCGRQLLKFLLNRVLEDIYSSSGKRLGDLDIAIIAAENITEALELVRLMEDELKYVTIAVGSKEAAELEADRIFGDLGLSISIVNDCRAAIRNADIIINLAACSFLPRRAKTRPAAMVFNLAGEDISRSFPECSILNGLAAGLPAKEYTGRFKEILKYYSRRELSGLAMAVLLDIEQGPALDYERAKRLQQAFERYGFRIEGFTGRHNIIKMDFLQKIAGASS